MLWEWEGTSVKTRRPIITGTDSNHGTISAKIISIIQMLLAWAPLAVIMVARLTRLASKQQDSIKVTMATRISTMTIAGADSTAAPFAVEVAGVAATTTTTMAAATDTVAAAATT